MEPVLAKNYGESLFTLPNLIVTPHVAASTIEVVRDSTVTAMETAVSYCRCGSIGPSTLVRELQWEDLTRRPGQKTIY
jgi:phosphoglycerate dehydrogenase-like enzyme